MTPSGFYVASADQGNNVIIWDTVGEDHVVKLEKSAFGKVADMAWSPDSKRLVIVGAGSNTHGEAFMIDGGASVGAITQVTKPLLSCDYRPDRPFRVITGSEDTCVNWYEGPPFKFNATAGKHSRFVSCVRFSPNAAHAVSVGTDKKIVLYDGKTFEVKKELENAHGGGIYGVSWSSDSNRFVTASADKTCKIWDAELTPLITFSFGNDLMDQQLGCLWQGSNILSLNLAGDISLLDEYNPSKPREVIYGHSVAIEALAYNPATDTFYSSDRDGKIVGWNRSTGRTSKFEGAGHKSRVFGLAVQDGNLVSISVDDTFKVSSIASGNYHAGVKLSAAATGLDSAGGWTAISTREGVTMIKGDSIVNENKFSYGPSCVAVSSDGGCVAVGGNDKKIHVYDNSNGKLAESYAVEHNGALCSVTFSHDGSMIAGGDTDRDVCVWQGPNKISKDFGHSARVDKVKFCPDGAHIASASLDSSFIIWHIASGKRVAEVRAAHIGGVKDLIWVDHSNILTTGQDILIKTWTFNQ
jgi:WD40 repeat protein